MKEEPYNWSDTSISKLLIHCKQKLPLLNALQFAEVHCQIYEETNYAVYSDCKTLVEIVTEYRLDDIPSWQAAEKVTKCANTFRVCRAG